MVPALPLAQAIGRIGNWFNQELFGGPTDLPWAVEIDPEHRPTEYLDSETFHPTFLYEALWNLGLVVFLIWIGTTRKLRTGALLAVYVVGYLTARLWLETVRVDPATEIGGVRVNIWMSMIGITVAGGWSAAAAAGRRIRRQTRSVVQVECRRRCRDGRDDCSRRRHAVAGSASGAR